MGRAVTDNKRQIGERHYEVFMLPPKVALKVLTRLVKIIGEPLGVAGGSLAGTKLAEAEVTGDMLGRAIAALTDRLDEAMVLETVETLLGHVHMQDPAKGDVGTRPIRFDVDFGGRLLEMLQVAAFALEVNFADFFGASGVSGGLMAKARAAVTGLK